MTKILFTLPLTCNGYAATENTHFRNAYKACRLFSSAPANTADRLTHDSCSTSVVCSRSSRNQVYYMMEIHLVSVLAKIKEGNNFTDTFRALTLQFLPMIKW